MNSYIYSSVNQQNLAITLVKVLFPPRSGFVLVPLELLTLDPRLIVTRVGLEGNR